MKIDKTVQGAADKISGLLNPQAGQSEPEKTQPAPQEQAEPVKTEEVKLNLLLKKLANPRLRKLNLKLKVLKHKLRQNKPNHKKHKNLRSTESKYKVKS